jgi:putative NADH-flavin reductase
MKLTVFGASGGTGQHVVEQALAAGHEVTSYVRTPSKLMTQHAHLKVVQGDIADANRVEAAVAGADAVVSVLGPRKEQQGNAVAQGTNHILAAMKKHGVRRFVMAAGAGVRDPKDKPKPIDYVFSFLLGVLSKKAVDDMTETVRLARESGLEWTIIRVPRLTDHPKTDQIKIGYLGSDVTTQISRADMAAFMLKEVERRDYIHQAPVISN